MVLVGVPINELVVSVRIHNPTIGDLFLSHAEGGAKILIKFRNHWRPTVTGEPVHPDSLSGCSFDVSLTVSARRN